MTLSERCAYLKGLAEGKGLDETKAEGKLISELIALCGEMAEEIEMLGTECDRAIDYCEELDEDLGEVEEIVYDLCDDEDDDCYDDYEDEDGLECDGYCDGCSGCDEEDDDEDDFANMRCAICAKCGDTICFEEDMEIENIVCPSCGTALSEGFDEE